MNDELKQIKKIYGEEMMHLSRELFPSILEEKGTLLDILTKNIAPTHFLASEIIKFNLKEVFKNWIYNCAEINSKEVVDTDKNPFELMDLAGYTLYECKTESDIQSFKKYYKENELICTIYNGNRLNRCHVFFAVKKNVDDIKREDFKNPKREDLYGTSVISIQFDKGKNNYLSIKNRYNHTVDNPDSTFSNNLENIIPGLTKSFEKYLNLSNVIQNQTFTDDFLYLELNYVKGNDSKYYRYNVKTDTTYYCENNIIIDKGKVIKEYSDNKERYIVMDKYILDLNKKDIYTFDKSEDAFIDSIHDIGKINKIETIKNGEIKDIFIYYDDNKKIKISINKNNAITGYENIYVTHIKEMFLGYSQMVNSVYIPNAVKIEDSFLFLNERVKSISLPNVEYIGDNFLSYSENLNSIFIPNVKVVGNSFLRRDTALKEISMPKVEQIGDDYLCSSIMLEKIYMPNVIKIGNNFLDNCRNIKRIIIPSVQEIGDDFLFNAKKLNEIVAPNVLKIGNNFLCNNNDLEKFFAPKVLYLGYNFLYDNTIINEIYVPCVRKIGSNFLPYNTKLENVFMPYVTNIENNFLLNNEIIKLDDIYMPNIQSIGEYFIYYSSDFNGITIDDIRNNNYIGKGINRRI